MIGDEVATLHKNITHVSPAFLQITATDGTLKGFAPNLFHNCSSLLFPLLKCTDSTLHLIYKFIQSLQCLVPSYGEEGIHLQLPWLTVAKHFSQIVSKRLFLLVLKSLWHANIILYSLYSELMIFLVPFFFSTLSLVASLHSVYLALFCLSSFARFLLCCPVTDSRGVGRL